MSHAPRTLLSALAVVGALLLSGGLAAAPAGAATDAAATDSALTVRWAGDTSRAAEYQPQRDEASAHYGDFKDVTVTVSQTQSLTDQSVRVDVAGMPGATARSGLYGADAATNFVQAMQCWGPDPLAADFAETCAWGFMNTTRSSSFGVMAGGPNTNGMRATLTEDFPFRAVWGESVGATYVTDPVTKRSQIPLISLASGETTNEVPVARMGAGGQGWFNFETQSSDAAPHLGCGLAGVGGAGERCWLVLVPRGEHGGAGTPEAQMGSPIWQGNYAWQNRVVVPLDFQPTGATCPVGAAERPVAGSELLTGAMSSWQPALCRAEGGATYSFNSISDAVARDQLLTGQSRFVLTGRPLTESTVSEDLAEGLADAELIYAPLAVNSAAVGFNMREYRAGVLEELNLTPRLLAKLLTQSYQRSLPIIIGNAEFPDWAQSPTSVHSLVDDPEFAEANPGLLDKFLSTTGLAISTGPGLLTVPTSSDANAQLWAWIQSDAKARAFLSGEPDNALPGDEGNSGMTVNPNFLPAGHQSATLETLVEEPNAQGKTTLARKPDMPRTPTGLAFADGTPYSLADTPLDTLPRAESWQVPLQLTTQARRFDSTQYNPPRGTLREVATDLQRENRKMKTRWDATVFNAAGEVGDWATTDASYPKESLLMGVTDNAAAERFAVSRARLQLPNQPGEFVSADVAGMTAALATATPTEIDGVTTVDPTHTKAGQYPLTQIVWAAMRLDGSTAEERNDYAAFIEQVTTSGQQPGTNPGQLPVGYAPLTAELREQAAAAAAAIRAWEPGALAPGGSSVPPASSGAGAPGAAAPPAGTATAGGPGGPSVTAGMSPADAGETETRAPAGFTALLSTLGGTLLVGASGAIAVPGILRRRDAVPE